jgi:hypothetical protein
MEALMNRKEYESSFSGESLPGSKTKDENALEKALDIRKFEIDLYWKRTAYFWALTAAAFAGYFVVAKDGITSENEFSRFLVSCIGFLFTLGFVQANRGSKFWQENWEAHVDLLEDSITGPLYKTVIHQANKGRFWTAKISVSKVSQLICLFMLCIWGWLVLFSTPDLLVFSETDVLIVPLKYAKYALVGLITGVFSILMMTVCRTSKHSSEYKATSRKMHLD